MTDTQRTLTAFCSLIEVKPFAALHQRGREASTARYTLELADGRKISLGHVDNLWSQAAFTKTLLVSAQLLPRELKAAEWRAAIGAVLSVGVTVTETGETFEDQVREWVALYTANARPDKGAAALGEPYRQDGLIYVKPDRLNNFIRREYGEIQKLHELRHALAGLGFERHTVHYKTSSGRDNTASYYRAAEDVLRADE